ncbi:TolC family protein [Algoriphagus sp. PAP.12]|uniref:TolC family protein n=1 Tax=Algoriphagus sp. PAP.12 TaxID=2996678 RepID=UPI00227AAFF0|nr:TolC family protein [Algoriphagus sp. PAP.12]
MLSILITRPWIRKVPLTSLLLLFAVVPTLSQTQHLSLEECQTLARENYPKIQQLDLIQQSRDFSLENAGKGNLPQININGQATYQSDVTQIPVEMPGTDIEVLSKDQYKVFGEISQPLTDMAIIKSQKKAIEIQSETKNNQLEVELYQLKDRINQLYFGILLLEQQKEQVNLLKKDIETGIKQVSAAIENGVALPSELDYFKAEMLNADQKSIELESQRSGMIQMLELFINQSISKDTYFEVPAILNLSDQITRPELALFKNQKESILIQKDLISNKNTPRLNLFLQGGYGRPALNMLNNDFDFYYLGGLRVNWSISRYYTSNKEKSLLDIQTSTVELQQETFLLNTKATLTRQKEEINKYDLLMASDQQIIDLREKVKSSALSQLEYGTLTGNDFMTYVNAVDQARQNLVLHKMQYLFAQHTYQYTSGN